MQWKSGRVSSNSKQGSSTIDGVENIFFPKLSHSSVGGSYNDLKALWKQMDFTGGWQENVTTK